MNQLHTNQKIDEPEDFVLHWSLPNPAAAASPVLESSRVNADRGEAQRGGGGAEEPRRLLRPRVAAAAPRGRDDQLFAVRVLGPLEVVLGLEALRGAGEGRFKVVV